MLFSEFSDLRKGKMSILKRLFAIFFGVAMTLSFTGCKLIPKEKAVQAPALIAPANVKYDIKKVERGTIVKKFKETGQLKSAKMQEGFFTYERGGKLKNIYVKAGDSVKKGQVLAELAVNGSDTRVREQEIMYEKTKLNYENLKQNGAEEYELKQTALDLELAKMRLEEAKKESQGTKIVAAFNGRVVSVAGAKIGDMIEPLKPVVTIAESSALMVRYKLFGDNEFFMGMKAKVDYKGKLYDGEVVVVPTASGEDLEIKVDNIPQGASFGERVVFELEVAKRENVLKVPKTAIHEYDNQIYVEKLENGMRVEKYVKVGVKTEDEVEIIEGLNEGEEIIVE